jgi:hypothetical protein
MAKPSDLQKDLRLRHSHVARSWNCRAPPTLTAEVSRPEFCLDIGVVGSDDVNERRSTQHKLQPIRGGPRQFTQRLEFQRTNICFPIPGCLTASAKHGTGLVRATCARKDGMVPPDCAFCRRCDTDESRGKRDLNEYENWRRVELRRRK